MGAWRLAATVTLLTLCLLAPSPAYAYRPFDETDAGVAAPHTIELELGPVGYIHRPTGDTFVPGFIFFAFIGGTIVEGPERWTVRPAAEFFVADERGLPATISGLAAAIWRCEPNLSLDAAVRLAREDEERVVELRAGLTWVWAMGQR